jgi:hypothetical protein
MSKKDNNSKEKPAVTFSKATRDLARQHDISNEQAQRLLDSHKVSRVRQSLKVADLDKDRPNRVAMLKSRIKDQLEVIDAKADLQIAQKLATQARLAALKAAMATPESESAIPTAVPPPSNN